MKVDYIYLLLFQETLITYAYLFTQSQFHTILNFELDPDYC